MMTIDDIKILEETGALYCAYFGCPSPRRFDAPTDYESARKEFYAHIGDGFYPRIKMRAYKDMANWKHSTARVDDALWNLPRMGRGVKEVF